MSDWNHMHGSEEMAPAPGSGEGVSLTRRALIAAAVLAVPLAAVPVYRHLESMTAKKDKELEAGFALDDARYRTVDAGLIGYREVGRIDVGFDGARVITHDPAGNVVAVGAKELRRLKRDGTLVNRAILPERAWTVSIGADGTAFVGFKSHVETYDAAGNRVATWKPFDSKTHITSVAVNGDVVWVADAGRRCVLRCSAEGQVTGVFAKADPSRSIPGLVVPSANLDVAVGPDGLVWVANPGMHRLEAYSAEGQLERYWGSAGSGVEAFFACCNPADFVVLPDGGFITAEKQIARIKRYHADGRLHSLVADPASFGEAESGIEVAVNAAGQVLALERGTRVVRVYEAVEHRKEAVHAAAAG